MLCVNNNDHYQGRKVNFEWAAGCRDAIPLEAEFKFAGACKTKGFKLTPTTEDGTTDSSTGGLDETLVTGMAYEVTLDGLVRISDLPTEKNSDLFKYFVAEIAAGRQPSAWTRLIYPDVTITAFCIIAGYERSGETKGLVSFSTSFQATGSDFGLVIEDTI